MLTQNCIGKIKEVQLSAVVSKYVADLKKKGTNYQGCCPFHAEKTPSFVVNDVKGVYKCFGCGKGGNSPISFIIENENQTFYEACKTVAEIGGIALEYELQEQTEQQKEAYKKKADAATQQEQVLNYVVTVYKKMLADLPKEHPAKIWLAERKIDEETIDYFNIGWAGEAWNTVSSSLINQNLWDAANKLGISKRSANNDSNYDGYRSRIIFPITDRNGRYIGLGGRYIKINANDGTEIPKYINASECELYNKSAVLYGLNEAAKFIKEAKTCNIVEGYMDVISPARVGLQNIVATCGTAFTTDQIKLIKKYCNHVIMMRDNDDAGEQSFAKNLPELLKHGLRVEIRIYEGKDPDEFILNHYTENKFGTVEDAIIHYSRKLISKADGDLYARSMAQEQILQLLSNIPNEIIRNNYLDTLTKEFKWKAGDIKKPFQEILERTITVDDKEENSPIKFDAWLTDDQKEEFMHKGYLAINRKVNGKPNTTGYFAYNGDGKTEITNFLIKPLFRIEAGQDSRYLSEINNGRKQTVIDMQAKVMPSIDQFQGTCVAAGGSFLIYGSRNQWLRIITDLLHSYPSCIEIAALGWQPSGFWAWVDKAFIPGKGLVDYDQWGILEHKEQKYFLAAKSEAYSTLENMGSDPFENLRYLTYKTSAIKFEQWANQMHLVYQQKGIVGIAYAIISLFRDIVFNIDNNCPHLYGFGEPSSGKSKWAESITALFYYRRAGWNLNSGTDFAFNLYVSTFANAPSHQNEFDIEVIKPEWFQQIKGWFDGEGRIRGKLGSKTSIEIQKIVSTIILTGQKLVTADDNSVVTRSIIEGFSTKEYTEEEKNNYNTLRDWQDAGLGSLVVEILQYRKYFEDHYKERFNQQLSDWRKNIVTNVQLNQRIIQNYAHLATCYNIISERINLPQAAVDFTKYCFAQTIKWSSHIRTSDTLSEFWRTLEFLANNNKVIDGWDFDVVKETSINITTNRTETETRNFETPTQVLYVRLNNVHKLFQQITKQTNGKEGMTIENILFYFNSRQYYLGWVKAHRFNRYVFDNEEVNKHEGQKVKRVVETQKVKESKVTSCYAFLYQELGIDITRDKTLEEELMEPNFNEIKNTENEEDLPF